MLRNGNMIKWYILLIVTITAIAAVIIVIVNVNNIKLYFENNKSEDNSNDSNIITQINKKEGIVLEKSNVEYISGTSRLTSKITNNGVTKNDLRFKVKFVPYDDSPIIEIIVYIGKIASKEVKYKDSFLSGNIVNSKYIIYEVMN